MPRKQKINVAKGPQKPTRAKPCRPDDHAVTIMPAAALSGLSIPDLRIAYDGVWAAINAASGIQCQPRAWTKYIHKDGYPTQELTPGGLILDRIINDLHMAGQRIAEAAKASTPTDAEDAAMRAWLLLDYEFQCEGDDLGLKNALAIIAEGLAPPIASAA